MKLRVVNQLASLYIDGSENAVSTIILDSAANGYVSLMTAFNSSWFDNFSITPLDITGKVMKLTDTDSGEKDADWQPNDDSFTEEPDYPESNDGDDTDTEQVPTGDAGLTVAILLSVICFGYIGFSVLKPLRKRINEAK